MSFRCVRFALFIGGLAALTNCAQCAPDRVAVGVGQLTVRNVGAIATILNNDDECGFASAGVLAGAEASGAIGSEGKLTFTVTDCEIDLGDDSLVSEDCTGGKTTASGKITVSATRVIGGVLTGDDEVPIVPGGPDAVTITLTKATFDNFEVKSSTSDSFLKMISGSLRAELKPRLAVSATSGACAIATPNVTFSGIAYDTALLHVESPDNSFDVDVADSSLSAQNGKNGGDENTLTGDITVFGSAQALDIDLDPEFDADKFAENYACTDDIAAPESFECIDLTPRLADGAARLTAKMLGTVAGLVDANTTCGFSADAVLGAGVVTGNVGGSGTLTLTSTACVISFANLTELTADCNDDSTTVSGSVTVTGTKTVSGRVTGNPASPIVPVTDQPAAIALSIVVDDFRVGSTADDNALTARTGTLAGTVSPKVFIGSDTGVCSVSSPNAGFDDVTWTTADLLVTSASGSFEIEVDSAAIEAANGTSGSGTNELSGTFTISGDAFTVPSDGAGLNPTFSQATLDASWQCDPDLQLPASDACGPTLNATVGTGMAALTARTFGTVVSLVDANSTCGFSSVPVAVVGATFAGGDVGDDGVTATFTIGTACVITLPADTVVATDCLGNTTTVSGSVSVTGTKTVTGWRTGDVAEPIVPNTSKPATFDLSMTFTGFVVEASTSTASLLVNTGSLAGVMQPRTALDPTTGACSIATPNVTFDGLTWTAANVTLTSDGNSFGETITTSAIDAQNGNDGVAPANTLAGSITVGGSAVALAGALDPEFDPAVFDSTYTCAANGSPVVVPAAACSFRQALGVGAARLLVKAAATAVSVHDGNPGCGFASDAAPNEAPSAAPPALGTLTFESTAACTSGFAGDTAIATNCVGTETHALGAFNVVDVGTKVVAGLFTGVANPSFVPVSRDAATLTLTNITFNGWSVFDSDVADVVTSRVTVNSGVASIIVNPITGRNAAASAALSQSVFTEKTGIAEITDLTMATADVTIVSGTKTFSLTLTNVDLDAFAGAFFDTALVGSNDLAGSLTVNGEPVTLAADTALDPAFDQTAFTATYSCNPTLGDPPDTVPFAAP